jgi:hypothetical protein
MTAKVQTTTNGFVRARLRVTVIGTMDINSLDEVDILKLVEGECSLSKLLLSRSE